MSRITRASISRKTLHTAVKPPVRKLSRAFDENAVRAYLAGLEGLAREASRPDLDEFRRYLGSLEAVAHHGRNSADPREVAAALRLFAKPSWVLCRLAAAAREAIG